MNALHFTKKNFVLIARKKEGCLKRKGRQSEQNEEWRDKKNEKKGEERRVRDQEIALSLRSSGSMFSPRISSHPLLF